MSDIASCPIRPEIVTIWPFASSHHRRFLFFSESGEIDFRSALCSFSSPFVLADIPHFLPGLGEMLWDTTVAMKRPRGVFQRLLNSADLPLSEGNGSAGDERALGRTVLQWTSKSSWLHTVKVLPQAFLIVSLYLKSAERNLSHLLGRRKTFCFLLVREFDEGNSEKKLLVRIKSKRETVVWIAAGRSSSGIPGIRSCTFSFGIHSSARSSYTPSSSEFQMFDVGGGDESSKELCPVHSALISLLSIGASQQGVEQSTGDACMLWLWNRSPLVPQPHGCLLLCPILRSKSVHFRVVLGKPVSLSLPGEWVATFLSVEPYSPRTTTCLPFMLTSCSGPSFATAVCSWNLPHLLNTPQTKVKQGPGTPPPTFPVLTVSMEFTQHICFQEYACVCVYLDEYIHWVNIFWTHLRVNGWNLGVPVSSNLSVLKQSTALPLFPSTKMPWRLPSILWGALIHHGLWYVQKLNPTHTGCATWFFLTLWSGPASRSVRSCLMLLPLKLGWVTTRPLLDWSKIVQSSELPGTY